MREVLSILVVVGGGLGTFLLGMKHLSEGLQSVSGSGLRRFMSLATTHRLAGIGTGVVSTMIVQSSSIITVMAVGFVTSGFMTLPQAINVIIGSNIGTTATAWIIAFAPDVKTLGLLVVLLGVHDGIASFAAKVSGYLKSPRPKFDLLAVQAESAGLRDLVRDSRRRQLDRVGPDDPSSPVRVLVELDILNAYERIRGYYLNIAETLAGGKG